MKYHVQNYPTVQTSPPLHWQSMPNMLNVFEAACSSAVHVTLWWFADMHNLLTWPRSFNKWVAIEQLGAWVYIYMCCSTNCSEPFAKCTVVTYVSPVKVRPRPRCLVSPWLLDFSILDALITWFIEVQSAKLWNFKVSEIVRSKELAVFKKHKYTVLWCKMLNCYEWNVMHKNAEAPYSKYRDFVWQHHAQNIEHSYWNILLKI